MAPKKAIRAALYLRVSTDDQTTENQRLELVKVAKQRGWTIVETYIDHGISGAKGRDGRPAFDRLCKDMIAGKWDICAAWSVDRLGRSLIDLLTFLREVHAVGVDLYLHLQGIDTTTPGGKALFSMMGVFAEFERAIIQERVRAGLLRARSKGVKLGRPRVSAEIEAKVIALRNQKNAAGEPTGINSIARALKIGVPAVQRIVRAARIRELHDAGKRPAAIAKELEIDLQAVEGVIAEQRRSASSNG